MFRIHKNTHTCGNLNIWHALKNCYGPWDLTMQITFGINLDMFGICLCIQPQTSASTDSSCETKSRKVLADTSVLSSWVGEHGNRVSSCGCAEGSKESDSTSIASADCTSVPNKFSGIPIQICSFMQLNFNVWCLMPLMDSISIYH